MKIESQKIKDHLITEFIGSEMHIFDSVESTNDIAKELAVNGCREGTVVIADSQSKGKGRLGRRWESPSGVGIYLSIVLKPKKVMPQLTLVTGVSASEAIISSLEVGVRSSDLKNQQPAVSHQQLPHVSIKWPNDIIIRGKKVGGILTESIVKGKGVIVGIGINVNTEISMFPHELRDKATSLFIETRRRVDRNVLIAELLNRFEFWYKKFNEEGEAVIKRWREFSDTIGRRIKVNSGEEVFDGFAEMLTDDGSLILRLNNGFVKKISAGEVCY